MHSSLSIGLPLRDNVAGVLTVYFATPYGFDDDVVTRAEIFAGYVIMGTRRCTAEEAFAVLADISRRTQRSMGDVAADIVASTA